MEEYLLHPEGCFAATVIYRPVGGVSLRGRPYCTITMRTCSGKLFYNITPGHRDAKRLSALKPGDRLKIAVTWTSGYHRTTVRVDVLSILPPTTTKETKMKIEVHEKPAAPSSRYPRLMTDRDGGIAFVIHRKLAIALTHVSGQHRGEPFGEEVICTLTPFTGSVTLSND